MCRFRRLLKRLEVSERGTATIEGAIVMPFLILLFVGIADFGRVLWHYQIVVDGVRDATRYLSRVPLQDPDDCTSFPAGTEADAQALATTGRRTGGTAKLDYWTTITVTPSGPTDLGGALRRESCLIQVTASPTFPVLMLGFVGIGDITFTIRDEARHYGD